MHSPPEKEGEGIPAVEIIPFFASGLLYRRDDSGEVRYNPIHIIDNVLFFQFFLQMFQSTDNLRQIAGSRDGTSPEGFGGKSFAQKGEGILKALQFPQSVFNRVIYCLSGDFIPGGNFPKGEVLPVMKVDKFPLSGS